MAIIFSLNIFLPYITATNLNKYKMKRFFTLSFPCILFIAFSSCDKIKDAATEDIYTTMSFAIPVAAVDTTAKSALVDYSFSETLTESLENNDKVSGYLDLLKKIEVIEFNVEISGLASDQIIKELNIEVEGIGIITTLENTTPSDLNISPDINPSVLVQIANLLYFNKQLTVNISGTTNEAPMNFTVKNYFDMHIETSPL